MVAMNSALYKDTTVTRGFTYHYYHSPASAGKPTLLFLHGYPSSSYDWHRQVEYFQPQGYGVLVPDCLGSGGTSKPDDPDLFTLVALAQDVADVLDAARVDKAVGIGHDWGSAVLSRLSDLHAERFEGFVWLALAYIPSFATVKGLARLLSPTGDDALGYWRYFADKDAYLECEKNVDSFIQLLYPVTPELWKDWFLPVGKTKEWIEGDRQMGRPHWMTQEEYRTIRDTLARSGLKSPNMYYGTIFSNANAESESKIPRETLAVRRPVLFLAATRDAVCVPAAGKSAMAQYAPHAKVVEIDRGHWLQFEATEQVNKELEAWLGSLGFS